MIISLIGIQTIFMGMVAGHIIFKRPKKVKLQLKSNENGFKIYKVKGNI